jgi:NitT/TauT family transport system substrate-binding protein
VSHLNKLLVAFSLVAAGAHAAAAAEKVTFLMSWKAEAEHGGYYDALVKGFYSDCGVDMTIRQGAPGIDPAQLLAGGAVEFTLLPFIDTVLQLNQAGFPARAVMGTYQRTAQIFMTHADNGINSPADMRGKPIMISAVARTTFWPFFRDKFGWSDSQIRAFSGQLAPFFADKQAIQQDFISNGPFLVKRQTGETPKIFLFADYGYQTYGSMVSTSQDMIDKKPKVVACVVQASVKGWNDYLTDPKPAFEIIKKEDPQNTDDLLAYAYGTLKDAHLIQTEETEKSGLGIMNDERWKTHYEMLVSKGLLKPMDYKPAYNLQFLPKKAGN